MGYSQAYFHGQRVAVHTVGMRWPLLERKRQVQAIGPSSPPTLSRPYSQWVLPSLPGPATVVHPNPAHLLCIKTISDHPSISVL